MGLTVVAAALVAGGTGLVLTLRHGFSARDNSTKAEAVIARRLRRLALPAGARRLVNPIPDTPQVLSDGLAHFADHCASCHGNDGRGVTEIGQNLYPKAPDMTRQETQTLSDGELFFIIKNGVRLTGMPAWGKDTPEDDRESWKLVRFIRHLPKITEAEMEQMKAYNPVSPAQLREEQEEREFLEQGGETSSPPPQKHPSKHRR